MRPRSLVGLSVSSSSKTHTHKQKQHQKTNTPKTNKTKREHTNSNTNSHTNTHTHIHNIHNIHTDSPKTNLFSPIIMTLFWAPRSIKTTTVTTTTTQTNRSNSDADDIRGQAQGQEQQQKQQQPQQQKQRRRVMLLLLLRSVLGLVCALLLVQQTYVSFFADTANGGDNDWDRTTMTTKTLSSTSSLSFSSFLENQMTLQQIQSNLVDVVVSSATTTFSSQQGASQPITFRKNQEKVELYHHRPMIQDILQATSVTTTRTKRTGSHAEETTLVTIHNHTWIPFRSSSRSMSSTLANQDGPVAAGTNEEATTTTTVDMTRNVPRIQDYVATTASHSPTQTLMQKQPQQPPPQRQASRTTTTTHDSTNADSQQNNNNKNNKDRMNIVLFYADDWTMQVLGALNPHVHTPNLNAMAERGMLFTHNCVTTSICWISRNTLNTGVYSSVHGNVKIGDEYMFRHSQFHWYDTLYPLLKQQGGYYTGLVGKWHAPAPRKSIKVAFDKTSMYYGKHIMMRNGRQRHVTDLNGEDAMAFLHLWNTTQRRRKRKQGQSSSHKPDTAKNGTNDKNNDDDDDNEQTDEDEKPFFLKLSFFATHAWDGNDIPYIPMNESLSLYENDTIPLPHTATQSHYKALPEFMQSRRNVGRNRNRNCFDTPTNYQHNIKDLYRMGTEVDAVIGAVIQELQNLNVCDKTMLIFTTDNGNLHGEHGLTEKWFPYEESIRVPLIIQDPRMPLRRRGTRNHDFTLNVDLAPTILSAAQIPIPSHMQGRDIAQLYLDDDDHYNNNNNSNKNPPDHENNDKNNKDSSQQQQQDEEIEHSWRQDFFYEWNTVRWKPQQKNSHIFKTAMTCCRRTGCVLPMISTQLVFLFSFFLFLPPLFSLSLTHTRTNTTCWGIPSGSESRGERFARFRVSE